VTYDGQTFFFVNFDFSIFSILQNLVFRFSEILKKYFLLKKKSTVTVVVIRRHRHFPTSTQTQRNHRFVDNHSCVYRKSDRRVTQTEQLKNTSSLVTVVVNRQPSPSSYVVNRHWSPSPSSVKSMVTSNRQRQGQWLRSMVAVSGHGQWSTSSLCLFTRRCSHSSKTVDTSTRNSVFCMISLLSRLKHQLNTIRLAIHVRLSFRSIRKRARSIRCVNFACVSYVRTVAETKPCSHGIWCASS
jgi:hypothetical protein